MTNSTPVPSHETWQVPQCPFTIEYDLEMMRRISRDVADGFRALPHGGLEVGGLLLGAVEGDRLLITGYEPLPCEHANGPSFHLTEEEKKTTLKRLQHYAEQDGKKVLGWYHSHTRSALSLTPEDMAIHYKLFTEPWQVALVLQPWGNAGIRGGFFFREPGGSAIRTSASYKEFTVEPEKDQELGRPLIAVRGPALGESVGGGAAAVRATIVNLERAPSRVPVPMPPPRSRWPVWTALVVMFLIAIGAVVYLRSYYAPSQKSAANGFVKVEAIHQGGNIAVTWDPKSLGAAKQGQLDIQDGPIQARLTLDERTLQLGSVSYAYKSEVTGFHLRVERADGTIVEGSTTYVAPNGPERADAKPEEAQPESTTPESPSDTAKAEPPAKDTGKPEPPAAKAPVTTPPSSPAQRPVETAINRPPASQPPVPSTQQTVQPPPVQQQQPVQQAPAQVAQTQRPVVTPPATTQPNNTPLANVQAAPPKTYQRPVVTPPSKPVPPPSIQLGGRWVLSPGSPSQSPTPAESVVITATERDGGVAGTVTAKYKGAKVNFNFAGRTVNGVARFPFTGKDGVKGEIEFLRVPGISDMAEVVWYGADVKQVYDHILRKVQ